MASNTKPAKGGPTIDVTPLKKVNRPKAEVRLSSPRRSTRTEKQ